MTPYGVGKFNMVSDSRSGFLMSRASFQVPTCLCFDQWLLKWLVMQTAAASSAAAVCITRCFSNRWPRFPKFTRPQWVKLNLVSHQWICIVFLTAVYLYFQTETSQRLTEFLRWCHQRTRFCYCSQCGLRNNTNLEEYYRFTDEASPMKPTEDNTKARMNDSALLL